MGHRADMKTVEIEANIAAGGVLKLDHLPFAEGEKVHVAISTKSPAPSAVQPVRRLGLGEHAGQAWMSEDFDAPLPEAFWTSGK
jgi:hypothetical protein